MSLVGIGYVFFPLCLPFLDLGIEGEGHPLIQEQTRTANAAGFFIHSEIHKARPDIHAICHAHSNAGRAWSAFGTGLDMINQDICDLYDAIAVYNEYGGIVFAEEEGKNIARALGVKNKVSIYPPPSLSPFLLSPLIIQLMTINNR
jgi:ribulose-5-phosphate 4-epimerase/fuculose-1-phosphate aldolase